MAWYLARSAAMNLSNSAGVEDTGSAIRVSKRVLVSGAASASAKARLSLSSTGLGVPAGATRPHQVSMAKPGKVLDSAGTPGSSVVGFSEVTANALSLPERILGAAAARLSMLKSTSPDSRASWAGLAPR